MNKFHQPLTHIRQQAGTALMVSLLILLVMTIISVTALKNTMLDENMARNVENKTVAFQGADSAVTRTLELLREDEEIANAALLAADNEDASNPTEIFPDIQLTTTKQVTNNVEIAYDDKMNPRGSCANYDCPFIAHGFNIMATASVNNTHAVSSIQQNAQKEPYLKDTQEKF